MHTIDGLRDFLSRSHSAFHAVDELCKLLDAKGFEKLNENAPWDIEKGGRYYVTRNLSSVLAFTIPHNGFSPFMIAASHSDSPTFRIKENAEIDVQGKYTMLNTEPYGGAILSTWLDRPLSVAGRVFVKDGAGVSAKLVRFVISERSSAARSMVLSNSSMSAFKVSLMIILSSLDISTSSIMLLTYSLYALSEGTLPADV